jgi:hypothetical protein
MLVYLRLWVSPYIAKGFSIRSIYCCSKTRWICEELFFLWLQSFKNCFETSNNDPVISNLDNHASHISLQICNYLIELSSSSFHFTPPVVYSHFILRTKGHWEPLSTGGVICTLKWVQMKSLSTINWLHCSTSLYESHLSVKIYPDSDLQLCPLNPEISTSILFLNQVRSQSN